MKLFLISIQLILILHYPGCTKDQVTDYGIFGLSRIKTVAGQDGCTPIPIGDNLMMWTFGDTILGSWKDGVTADSVFEKSAVFKGLIQNSGAFTDIPDDQNFMRLEFRFLTKNSRPVELIGVKNEMERNLRFWTVDGIKLGNSVYLYYMIMERDDRTREFPFKYTGMGIARWNIADGWKGGDDVDFIRLGKIFNNDEASFGDSVIKKDEYLYLTGHKKIDKTVSLYIARVSGQDILNRKKYMFLKRDGSWSNKPMDSHGFFNDVMGEPSLSYNEYLKSFVIIYCSSEGSMKLIKFTEFRDLSETVPAIVYVMPKLPEIKSRLFYFYYSGKEIFHTSSGIYAIYMNPAIYQPMLIKIPYGLLNMP